MSAESGIQTFRGAGKLWDKFKPEELATPQAFLSHTQRVQEWYDWRREQVENAETHDGHSVLARLESVMTVEVVTQNVDRLHQRAGSSSVNELHGNILQQYCFDCKEEYQAGQNEKIYPRLCRCGGKIRPAVVWFGEALPQGAIQNAEAALADSDLLLIIGTMGAVYPAAGLVDFANSRSIPSAEINLEPSLVTDKVDFFLRGKAGTTLVELFKALQDLSPKNESPLEGDFNYFVES